MKAVIALLCAGCGAPAATTVCDGSSEVRLAVRFGAGGPLMPGEHALYDNGASFLFVDGTCTYHVKTGGRWEDVVRGTTDDATLIDALELDELVDGSYTGALADAGTFRLAFDGAAVSCASGCMGGDVPEAIAALAARAAALLGDLRATGFTQAFPQRVLVVDEAVPATPAFLWPATVAPADLAVPADVADTAAATLIEGADAVSLRALRRDVRDAQFPPAAAYVTVDDVTPPRYAAFLRDALPYEGADGVVADP